MVVLLFLVLVSMTTVLPDSLQGYSYRFTSAKCNGSSKNTTSTHFCFIKNYNRTLSTMNFGFTLTRDLNIVYLKYSVDFKYGSVFHTVMDPPVIEWCSFYNGKANNVLFNVILDMVQDSVPGFIHSCPYKVVHSIPIKIHIFKIFNIILESSKCLQHDFKIETR